MFHIPLALDHHHLVPLCPIPGPPFDSNLLVQVHRPFRFANRLSPTMVTAGSTVRTRAAANGLVGFRRGSTGV
ncbi:hypothetical protein B0H13DRAFT_2336325 [Mycena leptocephala]|nr:hypothetical protein B0H13DRAFT_2336325 [Mycena leptocephala]